MTERTTIDPQEFLRRTIAPKPGDPCPVCKGTGCVYGVDVWGFVDRTRTTGCWDCDATGRAIT